MEKIKFKMSRFDIEPYFYLMQYAMLLNKYYKQLVTEMQAPRGPVCFLSNSMSSAQSRAWHTVHAQ